MARSKMPAHSIVDTCITELIREQPHGFSDTKIKAAALIALTAKTATQIGNELRISGYTVRDWLMEENFKSLITGIRRDAGKLFVKVTASSEAQHHTNRPVEHRLVPVVEPVISEEIKRRVKTESPRWLGVAHNHLDAFIQARSEQKIDERVIKRALRDRESKAWMAFGELTGNGNDPLVEARKLLRQRIYEEIAKLLPKGEAGNTARELLAVLCGDNR